MLINLPGDINLLGMLKTQPQFARPFLPAVVDSVKPGSVAAKMGMRKGDRIRVINNTSVDSYNEFTNEVGRMRDMLDLAKTHADSTKALSTSLTFMRMEGGKEHNYTRYATLSDKMEFGFYVPALTKYYTPVHKSYSFFESFPAGVSYGWNVLAGYVGDMKYLFSADGAKSLGGFGAIGSLFPPMWDWHAFWLMTAFLSIILAFMNILPIPALDGGHVLFLLYEMITRRKPSENFMIRAEYVGIAVLMLLMIVANLNDVLRLLHLM